MLIKQISNRDEKYFLCIANSALYFVNYLTTWIQAFLFFKMIVLLANQIMAFGVAYYGIILLKESRLDLPHVTRQENWFKTYNFRSWNVIKKILNDSWKDGLRRMEEVVLKTSCSGQTEMKKSDRTTD